MRETALDPRLVARGAISHGGLYQSLSYQWFEGDFIEILIDCLRFTSKIHNWVDLAEMLGLQKVEWEQGKARDGWLYHEVLRWDSSLSRWP